VETFNFDLSGIESQIELARKKVDHFKTLQERTLTTKELEEFFKDIEEQKLIQVRSIPTVQETLKNEMELLGQGANTWLLYNSINGMINHYMPNETYLPETKSALDTKVLSFITDRFDVALN
jgi:CRISPR/Cas system type I-B associated protein Csh2 (Cas7 group RAMP superfamily)